MIDREWRMRNRQSAMNSAVRRLEESATAFEQGRFTEARELAASAQRSVQRLHEWDAIWADFTQSLPDVSLLCESALSSAPALLEALDSTGLNWRCQVISAGTSLNGNRYDLGVLHEAASRYNLVPVYLNRGKDHDMNERGAGAIAGRIKRPQANAQGIEGVLAILPGREDVRGLLEYAHEFQQSIGRNLIGLSHVVEPGDADLEPLPHRGWHVKQIRRVASVDIVMNPSAGGQVLAPAA